MHPVDFDKFVKKKAEGTKTSGKRKRKNKEPSQSKKPVMQNFFVKKPLPISEQDRITQSLLDFIIADAKPISTVDSPFFRRFTSSLNPRYKMVGRMGMGTLIVKEYQLYKTTLVNLLKEVQVVCLTADSWSSRHRAFLGVTIHWLEPKTLARVSKALALKRFYGNIYYHAQCK